MPRPDSLQIGTNFMTSRKASTSPWAVTWVRHKWLQPTLSHESGGLVCINSTAGTVTAPSPSLHMRENHFNVMAAGITVDKPLRAGTRVRN